MVLGKFQKRVKLVAYVELDAFIQNAVVVISCDLNELILQLCSFSENIFKECDKTDVLFKKVFYYHVCIDIQNLLVFPILSLSIGF